MQSLTLANLTLGTLDWQVLQSALVSKLDLATIDLMSVRVADDPEFDVANDMWPDPSFVDQCQVAKHLNDQYMAPYTMKDRLEAYLTAAVGDRLDLA